MGAQQRASRFCLNQVMSKQIDFLIWWGFLWCSLPQVEAGVVLESPDKKKLEFF
jgi:hypothetical protein